MVVNDSPQSVGDVISQIKAEWGLDGRHIILVRDGGRVQASLPATILKPGSTIFVEEVVGVAKPGVAGAGTATRAGGDASRPRNGRKSVQV
jgi:hypothetical protein